MLHLEEDIKLSLEIMSDILQETPETVRTSRKGLLSFARAIIAEQLINTGYNKLSISRALGKNHATIIIALRKLESVLKLPGYNDVRDLRATYIALLKNGSNKLIGTTVDKCIWNVTPENRLCTYCKVTQCINRK